ncbi:hypothetical protein F441_17446 [Phytophthora nicotianae CJ01A1]|uniref:Uncharacterized protein n=6 Tax=Phytophthora nicotianae TaxID=4792 RepID=W2R108_PHYN3|nr:hypothetical protein PPTG_21549 [Phytophthora nicotianae INRA-310]ETI36301.1 hypothetical protein F443_17576 [Phytophthora nicotianae P1569]ETK76491.1 hypothetical protein L915_17111 [Phytophthora nicotianae]ETO64958.1 hypothetical protein F444_17619 [Phytophthora nicotianae P1976]ETP06091.1 hypothetical protein F441_17446 [Phytophthora nicotianae CJ01A1]ETP34169.1 hypothetical protein F442_17433 [Phytophthora nicotianae P10297]
MRERRRGGNLSLSIFELPEGNRCFAYRLQWKLHSGQSTHRKMEGIHCGFHRSLRCCLWKAAEICWGAPIDVFMTTTDSLQAVNANPAPSRLHANGHNFEQR